MTAACQPTGHPPSICKIPEVHHGDADLVTPLVPELHGCRAGRDRPRARNSILDSMSTQLETADYRARMLSDSEPLRRLSLNLHVAPRFAFPGRPPVACRACLRTSPARTSPFRNNSPRLRQRRLLLLFAVRRQLVIGCRRFGETRDAQGEYDWNPQRPRQAEREAATFGGDRVGGHFFRIPRAAVRMNANQRASHIPSAGNPHDGQEINCPHFGQHKESSRCTRASAPLAGRPMPRRLLRADTVETRRLPKCVMRPVRGRAVAAVLAHRRR